MYVNVMQKDVYSFELPVFYYMRTVRKQLKRLCLFSLQFK